MADIRQALVDFVRQTLQAHDPNYRIEQHVQLDKLDQGNDATRRALMGDPARYAEVMFSGRIEPDANANVSLDGYGKPRELTRQFEIDVWQERKTESDDELWDRTIEGDTPDGLFKALQEWPGAVIDGVFHRANIVGEAPTFLLPLNESRFAHYARATVIITG